MKEDLKKLAKELIESSRDSNESSNTLTITYNNKEYIIEYEGYWENDKWHKYATEQNLNNIPLYVKLNNHTK